MKRYIAEDFCVLGDRAFKIGDKVTSEELAAYGVTADKIEYAMRRGLISEAPAELVGFVEPPAKKSKAPAIPAATEE